MTSTLQNAKHRVCTAFGDSTSTYGDNLVHPLQGIGQGNGNGPGTWVAISSVLIGILRNKGFGLNTLTTKTLQAIAISDFALLSFTRKNTKKSTEICS